MDDVALHPAEQARRVRVSAIAAGERMSWPVPQGLLDRIVAETAGLNQSLTEAERVAVSVVERARMDSGSGTAPRSWEASNAEANRYFRVVFGQVVYGQNWLPAELAARDVESGGRFAELANMDLTGTPEMASVLERADHCGMGWLRHNRELLQLGPGAIQALVDARFKRETFERSIRNGYHARDVVGWVEYARERKRDPHRVAEAANEAVEILGQDNPEGRRNFQQLYQNLGRAQTAEEREAAERALVDAYQNHQPRNDEEKAVIERGINALTTETQAAQVAQVNVAQANATTTQAAADRNRDAQVGNTLGGLLEEPPSAPAAPPKPTPTQHVMGPR